MAGWFHGASIPDNATIVVTVKEGNAYFYISRIDNGSNDSVVFAPFGTNK